MVLVVTDIQKERLIDEIGCEWTPIKPDGVYQLIVPSGVVSTTAVFNENTHTLTVSEPRQHCYAVTSAALDDHLMTTWNAFSKGSNIVKHDGMTVTCKQTFLGVMCNTLYNEMSLSNIAIVVAGWLKKECEFL